MVGVMTGSLHCLDDDLLSLRETWTGALPAFGIAQGEVSADVASMSDAGLLATTDALAHLVRDAEAVMARVAGEIARRSPASLGKEGLAKKQGFQNPAHLVAAATGGAVAGAARIVGVGKATAPRLSLTGEVLPPAHPHVAAGLAAGSVSVDAASAITTMLDRVAPRADSVMADGFEQLLTERAADLPHTLLLRMIRECEARLDQDGLAPREEAMRAARSVRLWEDSAGRLRLAGVFDPETGAPIKGAVEALVTEMIRASGKGGGEETQTVIPDERTIVQMQADAMSMIARHVAGCSQMPSTPSTTMVVRMELSTLLEGLGQGTVDGLTQPVSAGTIRKMAATAGIIPAVFGVQSLPLDLGHDHRLFSRAQRLALAERDGGCAGCGLDVAYTQAHHVFWWKRDNGPTDLNNGVLLCPPCHTRVHDDGWTIQIRDGQVWFTPPPHVDIEQKPRLGGKARYALPTPGPKTEPDPTSGPD
jgi:5-methylcytosine-specific restriction protein A